MTGKRAPMKKVGSYSKLSKKTRKKVTEKASVESDKSTGKKKAVRKKVGSGQRGAPVFPTDAIWEGRLDEVKSYVRLGGDINARPPGYENTLLIDAIRAGRNALFDWLLECGANPNGIDYAGTSALQHAAESGVPHFVQQLLERSASIHHADPGGLTALYSAALCDRTSAGPKDLPAPQEAHVIELLLEAGANPSVRDNAKRQPCDFIRDSRNQDGRELLT
jgi:ankyrin repeat protein